jgi:hypothetical protein
MERNDDFPGEAIHDTEALSARKRAEASLPASSVSPLRGTTAEAAGGRSEPGFTPGEAIHDYDMDDKARLRSLLARLSMLEESFARLCTVVGRLEMELREMKGDSSGGRGE